MRKTLTETVVDWVDPAIDAFWKDNQAPQYVNVVYDVAFQAFPDDEGRFFGQIAIYLQIPGPTEGTYVFATPILRPHGITEQLVADVVKQALTDMVTERELRREQTPQT